MCTKCTCHPKSYEVYTSKPVPMEVLSRVRARVGKHFLTSLRRALSTRRRNINVSRELNEGNEITYIARKYNIESYKSEAHIQFEQRWWLEKFFDRINLTYAQGTILIYMILAVVRLFFLPFILSSEEDAFRIAYFISFIGDMIIIIALLSIHTVQKGLVDLGRQVNDNLRKKRYVAPLILLAPKEETPSDKGPIDVDEEYQDIYIKPIFRDTLQSGFDLAFNKTYQLGCGLIAVSLLLTIFALRFVLGILPPGVFMFWVPIPEITFIYSIYTVFMLSFLWFVVGALAWTLFIVFAVILQVSGNPTRIRPFESMKDYFDQTITLTLKTSFTIAALVSWFSPYMLTWTTFPPDPLLREGATNFLRSLLVVMIPIIVISFLLPIMKIHRGMDMTRDRALYLKQRQLEKLKESPLTNLDKQLRVQEHLIRDYEDISKSSEWPINMGNTVQIILTIALPIATFLLSQLLRSPPNTELSHTYPLIF